MVFKTAIKRWKPEYRLLVEIEVKQNEDESIKLF